MIIVNWMAPRFSFGILLPAAAGIKLLFWALGGIKAWYMLWRDDCFLFPELKESNQLLASIYTVKQVAKRKAL